MNAMRRVDGDQRRLVSLPGYPIGDTVRDHRLLREGESAFNDQPSSASAIATAAPAKNADGSQARHRSAQTDSEDSVDPRLLQKRQHNDQTAESSDEHDADARSSESDDAESAAASSDTESEGSQLGEPDEGYGEPQEYSALALKGQPKPKGNREKSRALALHSRQEIFRYLDANYAGRNRRFHVKEVAEEISRAVELQYIPRVAGAAQARRDGKGVLELMYVMVRQFNDCLGGGGQKKKTLDDLINEGSALVPEGLVAGPRLVPPKASGRLSKAERSVVAADGAGGRGAAGHQGRDQWSRRTDCVNSDRCLELCPWKASFRVRIVYDIKAEAHGLIVYRVGRNASSSLARSQAVGR